MRRGPGPEVERFSLAQRAEHFVLLLLFNLLALTGLPQKYSSTAWAARLITVLGGIGRARFIHRTAAVLLITLGIYHLAVVVATRNRPVRRHDMGLSPRDLHELIGDIKFLAGLSRERPPIGRFDYRQKFEYWAVLWGTVLMAATGVIMWYPAVVTRWIPGVVIPASRVAHGGEALLALFAVIVWHFYNAHFRPDIFPMDPAMFTGKIPLERMEHEHRGEFEELTQAGLLLPLAEVAPAEVAPAEVAAAEVAAAVAAAAVAPAEVAPADVAPADVAPATGAPPAAAPVADAPTAEAPTADAPDVAAPAAKVPAADAPDVAAPAAKVPAADEPAADASGGSDRTGPAGPKTS